MEVYVYLMPLKKVKEVVTQNADGSHTVFIDVSLSREEQQKAYYHALSHITGLDFEKFDVQQIEADAHMPL